MDAGNLTARHGEQAVGIVIAHILLQDKGELRDVFERFQVARLDAGFLKRLLVERNVVVCVLYAPFMRSSCRSRSSSRGIVSISGWKYTFLLPFFVRGAWLAVKRIAA